MRRSVSLCCVAVLAVLALALADPVPLSDRVRLDNQVVPGLGWVYYSVSVDAAQYVQLQLEMQRTGDAGDPDLFVRFGALPDLTHYDFADRSVGLLHAVYVNQVQTGTYFIGVQAFLNVTTTFSIEARLNQCPNNCYQMLGHGVCATDTHVCTCNDGWTMGPANDCAFAKQVLPVPQATVAGTVLANSWTYFELDIPANVAQNDVDYQIAVQKTGSSTFFSQTNLYVAFGRDPTVDSFDYYSAVAAVQNQVRICSSSLNAGAYIIGINNIGGGAANFTLTASGVANCPHQCSGHGLCNYDGSCHCADGFQGADCSVDVAQLLSGFTPVGTAVFLSFFFLALGATPFLVWIFCGERIKAFIAARRSAALPDDYNTSTAAPTEPARTGAGSYQTF